MNGEVIRVVKRNNYVSISNDVLQDERLSWAARGLLAYLLSKPTDWHVMMRDLIKQSPGGREKNQGILKELERMGYLHRSRVRGARGRFVWTSIVYEVPRSTMNGFTVNGQTVDGSAVNGKAVHVHSTDGENTDVQNTEGQEAAERESSHTARAKNSQPSQNPPAAETLNDDELQRHPLFDALSELCNIRLDRLTNSRRDRFAKALRDLEERRATPDGLAAFGHRWTLYWRCYQNNNRAPEPREVLDCWQEVFKDAY